MFPESNVLVLLGAGVAAALTTWLVFALVRRCSAMSIRPGSFERTLDLTVSYLSHYLLASLLLAPLLGLTIGKPVTILILPVLHFFAAIVMFPGAYLISYVGDRWLNRTWSRGRAWAAGVLTVIGMWILSYALLMNRQEPPEMLQALLGNGLAVVACAVSVPMSASAVSLTLAWLVPSRSLSRDS